MASIPTDFTSDKLTVFEDGHYLIHEDAFLSVVANGMSDEDEVEADTDPLDPLSLLDVIEIQASGDDVSLRWIGGNFATQYLEKSQSMIETAAQWNVVMTNTPPTPITNVIPGTGLGSNAPSFFRVRAAR